MNIAIIGAGSVGSALGGRWSAKGHRVTFGLRDPSSAKYQPLAGPNRSLATVADAVRGAEVVVLATPWPATEEAVRSCGDLTGKIVIDCTNPLRDDFTDLAVGHDTSAAELIAGWAKGARVFKAFNQTGAGNMANPDYGPTRVVQFVCGPDDGKPAVIKLVQDVGFEPIDLGSLRAARWLEPMAMVWIHHAVFQKAGTDFAFAVIRRPGRR